MRSTRTIAITLVACTTACLVGMTAVTGHTFEARHLQNELLLSLPTPLFVSSSSETSPLAEPLVNDENKATPTPPLSGLGFRLVHHLGKQVKQGGFSAVYRFPFYRTGASALFGETEWGSQVFWRSGTGALGMRTDVSVSGTYNRIFGNRVMIGLKGFVKGSRLSEEWFYSPGLGLEVAANLSGSSRVDGRLTGYQHTYHENTAFRGNRSRGSGYSAEIGYSQFILDSLLKVRVDANRYRFDRGHDPEGWTGGISLISRGDALTLRLERGYRKETGPVTGIKGSVKAWFNLEEIFSGHGSGQGRRLFGEGPGSPKSFSNSQFRGLLSR